MRIRTGVLVMVACGVASAAAAQENVSAAKPVMERGMVAARMPFEKTVKGAPYSAETLVQTTQTLADGTHINKKTTGRIYRDAEGRTRREEENAPAMGSVTVRSTGGTTVSPMVRSESRTTVSIIDPVGGFSYSLDTENKIAWRTPMMAASNILNKMAADEKVFVAQQQGVTATAGAAGGGGARGFGGAGAGTWTMIVPASGGVYKTESAVPLEHATIDGLAVEGHHRTSTIAPGLVGNDQPITITSEEWTSPDLQVLVMTRHNDPRTGEQTYKLTNVVRAEPDSSLFMVPPDYTVKDTGIRKLEASSK